MKRISSTSVPTAALLLLLHSSHFIYAQQHLTEYVFKGEQGNKQVITLKSGWVSIEKTGTKTVSSPSEITEECSAAEEFSIYEDAKFCEIWGELQLKTQIERLPFPKLVSRLLRFSPPNTDFARYRGMQLKAGDGRTADDAILLPEGLGDNVKCTIEEEPFGVNRLNTYQCSIPTHSYAEAVALQKALVSSLSFLRSEEDSVREHGLTANAKEDRRCAPSGPCEEEHVFSTAQKDGKIFQIEAVPGLTRNADLEATMMEHGHHSPFVGINESYSSVTFEVFSIGPDKSKSADNTIHNPKDKQ